MSKRYSRFESSKNDQTNRSKSNIRGRLGNSYDASLEMGGSNKERDKAKAMVNLPSLNRRNQKKIMVGARMSKD